MYVCLQSIGGGRIIKKDTGKLRTVNLFSTGSFRLMQCQLCFYAFMIETEVKFVVKWY